MLLKASQVLKMLKSYNSELQLKDTEPATKSKLTGLLSKLRGSSFR